MDMSHYPGKPNIKKQDTPKGRFLTPFQRQLLQKSLQQDLPQLYHQRIKIMLLADEGKSQTDICQTLGCCPATVRHWMHIARTGMAHQWQDCPIGRSKAVSEEYLERLQELVSHSPRDYGYSFRQWTANWLRKHLAKEFGVEVSDRHINRLLKQMGLSTRAKKINAEENPAQEANDCKILIYDLASENTPINTNFLPINLTALGTDSDIYGAQFIRSVSVSATTGQYFGVFSFCRGISALSQTS